MQVDKQIQVIYHPGTFGKLFRFLLDRSLPNSKTKHIWNPFQKKVVDKDYQFLGIFGHAHVMETTGSLNRHHTNINKDTRKIIIDFDENDLVFIERCSFYRTKGMSGSLDNFLSVNSISRTSNDTGLDKRKNFLSDNFNIEINEWSREEYNFFIKSTNKNLMVAKEIQKINFHSEQNNKWFRTLKAFTNDEKNYTVPMKHLFYKDTLIDEIKKIGAFFNIKLEIDEDFFENIIKLIWKLDPIPSMNRANNILKAIEEKENKDCSMLDFIEQAWIECKLEKIHDMILFPYGTSWFKNTKQINEFIETYPNYLKQMNPRLPWHNKFRNPYYLTGKINDKKTKPKLTEPKYQYTIKEIIEAMEEIRKRPWTKTK